MKTIKKSKNIKKLSNEIFDLSALPDNVIQNIASKMTIQEGRPTFEPNLAILFIEKLGFFPTYWDLDAHLYTLLRLRPYLADKLDITQAREHNAIRTDDEGESSLFEAVQQNDVASVKGLLNAGVNVNAIDKDQYTPLHIAAMNGNIESVQFLIHTNGVNVNARAEYDTTPLHLAARDGHVECIEALLTAPGIKVNALTHDGQTPLHWAADYQQDECIKALLKSPHVNINIEDPDHMTPYDLYVLAKRNELPETAKTKNIKILLSPKKIRTTGGKLKISKEYAVYAGKKYVVRIGSRGGKYILVGAEKKKIYIK